LKPAADRTCHDPPVLIDIVTYDGLDEMDALGPLEVLRSASRHADIGVFAPGQAEVLIVPGGGWAARAEQGAWGEVARSELLPLLQHARETTRILAGVCTGTMLLAHAKLVGSRRANTHHSAWDDLAATGATVVKERVVDDGDLVTSGGVTSGIDLALWLLEREFSQELAERMATRMEYDRWRARAE